MPIHLSGFLAHPIVLRDMAFFAWILVDTDNHNDSLPGRDGKSRSFLGCMNNGNFWTDNDDGHRCWTTNSIYCVQHPQHPFIFLSCQFPFVSFHFNPHSSSSTPCPWPCPSRKKMTPFWPTLALTYRAYRVTFCFALSLLFWIRPTNLSDY